MITVTLFFTGFIMLALTLFAIKKREYRLQLTACVSTFLTTLFVARSWRIFEDGEIIFKSFNDGTSSDKFCFILTVLSAILATIALKSRMNVLTKRKNNKKLS